MKKEKVSDKDFKGLKSTYLMCYSSGGIDTRKTLTFIASPISHYVGFEVKSKDANGSFNNLYDAIEFYNKQ